MAPNDFCKDQKEQGVTVYIGVNSIDVFVHVYSTRTIMQGVSVRDRDAN